MRIVGLDYGRARIGIAKTDALRIIVEPFCTLKREGALEHAIQALLKILAPYKPIELFVVGLPLLLNGQEGDMAKEARAFGGQLQLLSGIPVVYWDERLTSAQAEKALKPYMKRKQRAQHEDALAASYILENYLQSI